MARLAAIKQRAVIAVAVAVWIPAVAYGFTVLLRYSTTPGQPAKPPITWPANAFVERGKHPMLVMFAHPQCPCTRASVGELALLMAHASGGLDADVFFYRPAGMDSAWVQNDLWRSASSIPGVRVHEDPEAAAARTFGAFTSGQTLLYAADGRLLFKGGITGFRGHSGDNAGRGAIGALLHSIAGEHGGQPLPWPNLLPITTPVLGCNLRGE